MPYDPNFPPHNVELISAQWRDQFHGLKELNDALAAGTVTAAVVDAVNTVAPGTPAAVTASVVGNTLHLTFALPQGADGAPGAAGATGDVSSGQLAAAIDGTSSNTNAVANLGMAVSDPPTQAELQAVLGKLNEVITALRR